MERFDELKLKYQQALNAIQDLGVRLAHLHVQDDKLYIQGAAPTEEIKNSIWDQIKAIDPSFADLTCDLSIDPSLAPPARTYTVQRGDSLWKIAQIHYGNGALYPRIVVGNPGHLHGDNPVIHPGNVLIIPA